MEYINGLSLKAFVQRFGPLMEACTIYILRQICASLEEAHAAGLVHRDIKPDNNWRGFGQATYHRVGHDP